MPTEVTGPEIESAINRKGGVLGPLANDGGVSSNTSSYPPRSISRRASHFPIRLSLRADRSRSKVAGCGSCHRRPLCECAHENQRWACSLEEMFWALLAMSAVATVLLALIYSI
jgi:hypothetical protein